jgi:hypothetical protein
MKNPLLVSTDKKGWSKCTKTGRHINKYPTSIQDSSKCISNEILRVEAVLKAIELSREFKDEYKNTTEKTIRVIMAIYSRLLSNPDRKLMIDSNISYGSEILIKKAGLKKVLVKMEELNHIIIYQGYAYKEKLSVHNKARPMCIESNIRLAQ